MGNRAVDPRRREGFKPRDHGASGGPGHLGGPRPQAPDRRTGQGYAHLGGVWPPCQPSSIACAQAHVGLAAKVLAGVGLAVPSALALPTHGGGSARPGAVQPSSTGLGVAGAGRVRGRGARSAGRVPLVPRAMTSAPCAGATAAPALEACWTSPPTASGLDWLLADP